jgi:cell division septum initiation protein DivIVA
MANGEKHDPHERGSTDEGLRTERERTDAELALRSTASHDVASDVVAEAREKADTVLSDARDLEDLKRTANATVTHARAHEDAMIEIARSGADATARATSASSDTSRWPACSPSSANPRTSGSRPSASSRIRR